MDPARCVRRKTAIIALALTPTALAGTATFSPLGDLAGGDFFSFALNVSADGSTIVGQSTAAQAGQAFRWNTGAFGILPSLPGHPVSAAYAVNGNGDVAVGSTGSGAFASGQTACLWANAINLPLGDLFGGLTFSEAWGISTDGQVVVGRSNSGAGMEAFRWNSAEGMQPLGDLLGGDFNSEARACSADGSVIVGRSSSANGTEAFRWTSGIGMQGLDDLPGGEFFSIAYDCSSDASVIVGLATSDNGDEAFRWTQGGGMIALGDLPGGEYSAIAAACSADGNTIVGSSFGENCFKAFIWTQATGMRALQDVLTTDYAIDLTGWCLTNTTGISDDALTITGYGLNPTGFYESFVVRIAAPSTSGVAGDANADGLVNARDLSIQLAHFGQTASANTAIDMNADGFVDGRDLVVLLDSITTQ